MARLRGDQGLERRRPGRDPVAEGGLRPGESASASDFCLPFPTGDRLGISWSREERGLSDAAVRLWEQVCLHGGQVVSWRNDRGEELLFTSSKVSLFQLPVLVARSYLWQCGFDPVTVSVTNWLLFS